VGARVVRKTGGLPLVVVEAPTWDDGWWVGVEWTECDHMETLPERDLDFAPEVTGARSMRARADRGPRS
jgi:hypothetical protein